MRNHRSLALIAFGALLGLVPLLWAARTQEPKAGQPKPAQPKPAPHAMEAASAPSKVTGSTVSPAGDIKCQKSKTPNVPLNPVSLVHNSKY